jgi:hypothetical protein
MAPIDEIKLFLSNYPDLNVEETADSISVLPKDFSGFKVRFKQWKNGYILSYGNWHEYLPKSELGAKVALGLFKFGLSDSCKLTICRKGNIDYHCSLSYNDPTIYQWTIIAKQKIFIYPFWEPEEVKVLQNDLLAGDQLSDLFESNEFEKVITELKYERKHAKYSLTYISIWTAIFLKLNNFDIGNIQVSFVLFSPVIILTFFLPVLIMRNWFDDRKFGRAKKILLSERQKKFLLFWMSAWLLLFLIIAFVWGAENLIPLSIIGFPFILVAFCIPIYLMMEKK